MSKKFLQTVVRQWLAKQANKIVGGVTPENLEKSVAAFR